MLICLFTVRRFHSETSKLEPLCQFLQLFFREEAEAKRHPGVVNMVQAIKTIVKTGCACFLLVKVLVSAWEIRGGGVPPPLPPLGKIEF